MSDEAQGELSALVEWFSSFPQLVRIASDKENTSSLTDNEGEYLSNPVVKR